jgi:hypothetical protein
MEIMMKSLMRLVPRVALGVVALGLIVFLIAQLPFWRDPVMEPMVSSTAIAVEGNESNDNVGVDLSADPGEVPLYRISAQPVPNTPEAMLAWARDFGLPEPALYERPFADDTAKYVVGSTGRRLIFRQDEFVQDIMYVDPQAKATGDPLPFAQASQIALDFLRDHNQLPATYQVDAMPYQSFGNGQQIVVVRATVEEGVVGNLPGYGSAINVTVTADGQIASASLPQLRLEKGESVAVISAQEAYEKLLAGESVGSGRGRLYDGGLPATPYLRPIEWQVGETVAVVGYLDFLVGVENGDEIVTFTTFNGAATFHLVGSRLTDLLAETWQQAFLLQGTVTAQLDATAWEMDVQEWQQVSYEDLPCLTGELLRQADGAARFRTDEGVEYGLPDAPAEIAAGEKLHVCLSLPGEPGEELDWSIIHVQVATGEPLFISGGGGGGGGVSMIEDAVVEQVVSEVVVVEGGGGGGGGTAVSTGIVAVATEAPFIAPESPYEIGDSVVITGTVQGIRVIEEGDSSRLELQLLNDIEQGDASYALSYPLLAVSDLLEEMAVFADLHIRVMGEVVSAPENMMNMSPNGQAINVASFDRPWPEEKLENFLGHFTIEEIAGVPRMVFTDHATNQRYVVDPQYPALVDEHDIRLNEEQVLVTAVIHPAAESIDGLPIMLNKSLATGSEIAQATDVSAFPLPTESRIGTIDEAFLHTDEIGENDVLERVELVYPYNPYANQSVMEAQSVEPEWVFYGRNAQGTFYFTFMVRARK